MTYPNKILIPSDGNELEYVSTDTNRITKEKSVTYRYTKSNTKLDSTVKWNDKELESIIKKNIVSIIN